MELDLPSLQSSMIAELMSYAGEAPSAGSLGMQLKPQLHNTFVHDWLQGARQ